MTTMQRGMKQMKRMLAMKDDEGNMKVKEGKKKNDNETKKRIEGTW